MRILSWIILGIIAGALGKLMMPGKDGGGIIMTMILGIVGAFVGGFIGSKLGIGAVTGFNPVSILTAACGSFIVLFIWKKFR